VDADVLTQLAASAPQVAVLAYVLIRLLGLHERTVAVLAELRASIEGLREDLHDR